MKHGLIFFFFKIGKTNKQKKKKSPVFTYQWFRVGAGPVVDQLVLEARDPSTDVSLRHCLDEQRPLMDAKAVHFALGLLGFAEQ